MQASRREALVGMFATGAAALAPRQAFAEVPEAELRPMTAGAEPITRDEHLARVARVQELMRRAGTGALIIEPGATMTYFTGVEWHLSERLTAAVIPARGRVAIVTPAFEEPSVRESLRIDAEVRPWNEDEDPLATVAGVLRDRRVTQPVAIEERVRYFVVDGLRRAMPSVAIRSGAALVRACRMIKTAHEIGLMQVATNVTIAAYHYVYRHIARGMTSHEIAGMMDAATQQLGGAPEFSLILLNEASAYPHGSRQPQQVREGSVVLMDCGCTVHGYQSDVSRTFIFGTRSAEQRRVWDQVHRGQQIAFEAAQLGRPAGTVDDAVRRWYESLGYGPGYRLPGLSHRTGHGIGLDGHEPAYFVHGDPTPLQPGMCFSNEPGIYIPGHFGIRLEDCLYMTERGPRWFSTPPPSIEQPFG